MSAGGWNKEKKPMSELFDMTALAKHLGITKVRIHTLCKEKRLKPDYEINGRYLWKFSSADKLKEAFKSPGFKGKPKVLDLQKKHKYVSQRKNPEDSVSVSIESAAVPETEKVVAPLNNSDKESLDKEEQDLLTEGDKQESQGEKEINKEINMEKNVEAMKQVKVLEEPKRFYWQCFSCVNQNKQSAMENDGSQKTTLRCYFCGAVIKFSQEAKVWYQSEK
jgi:hypothetical protein